MHILSLADPTCLCHVIVGSVQMVTSPGVSTPAVSSSPVESSEAKYTETLKKMEADCLKDLETAFDETAKKAKSESDKIWADLDAELDDEDA